MCQSLDPGSDRCGRKCSVRVRTEAQFGQERAKKQRASPNPGMILTAVVQKAAPESDPAAT